MVGRSCQRRKSGDEADRDGCGAAPGQQHGTTADVAAKTQADAEKHRTADADSATQACNAMAAPAKDGAPDRKRQGSTARPVTGSSVVSP